jgi:hypothetical protein
MLHSSWYTDLIVLGVMAFVFRVLRTNPYVVNYLLVGTAVLAPLAVYVETRSPTDAQVEHALVR